MADLANLQNEPMPPERVRLPALPAPELSVDFLARVKEIIESLLGQRGSNWDRAVTFRDLTEGQFGGMLVGGAAPAALNPATGQITVGGVSFDIDQALRDSLAYKTLMQRIGSAESNARLPDEIRAQLDPLLLDLARERRADLRDVELKLQDESRSYAYRLSEVTAALRESAAGVRTFSAAYADDLRAVALQVTQLAAQLEAGGGGVEIEERFEAIADAITGLQGQWSLKIQTNPTAGQPPIIAGIALSVEDPIAGPGTSTLIFLAEEFGFYTSNGTALPFGIVGNEIVFNGNVNLNGQLLFNDNGKLRTEFAPDGTLNADIVVGGRNLAIDSAFGRGLRPWEQKSSNVGACFIEGDIGARILFFDGSGDCYVNGQGPGIPVNPGQQYVIGFDYSTATVGTITGSSSYFYAIGGAAIHLTFSPLVTNGVRRRAEVLWTCPSGVSTLLPRFGFHATAYSWMRVYSFDVKEGNKSGGWSAAPEDVAQDIASAKNTADAVASALPGLNLAVAAKVDKNVDDVLNARLLLGGNGKVQLGADAANSTTIAGAGIVSKKAGVTNTSWSADGDIVSRSFTALSTNDEVLFTTGQTLAQQTMVAPNLAARLSSWPALDGGAVVVTHSADTRFANGEYLYLPANGNSYVGASSGPLNIPPGAVYTVSFDAYCEGAARTLIADVYNGSIDTSGSNVPLVNGIKRYKFTETMPNVGNSRSASLRLFAGGSGSNIIISNVKVEMGATATAWSDNVITKFNATTFIENGAFQSLAAFVAYFGNIELGQNGALRQGQTAYDTGVGIYLGADANGNAVMSMATANGGKLLFNPALGIFRFINPQIDEPKVVTGFSVSMPDVFLQQRANGSIVQFTMSYTPSQGVPPYKKIYSLGVQDEAYLSMIGDPTEDTVTIKTTGSNITHWAYLTLAVTDANGAVARDTARIRVQFGDGSLE